MQPTTQKALKPNVFVSVPRLWNRIYDRVMGAIRDGNPLSRALFERVSALCVLCVLSVLCALCFLARPVGWSLVFDPPLPATSHPIMQHTLTPHCSSYEIQTQAYAYKKAAIEAGDLSGGRWAPFWDRVVFSKIKAKLGGEVKFLTTGRWARVSEV
jgi:long-subunit acyl-CoA synthetase (AMP-forming)